MTNNPNVTWDGTPNHKYTYGNSTMVVNASTLAENVTWYIWLNDSNYLLDFFLESGGTPLELPYRTNVTNILDVEFVVSTPGNTSYWIDYPNGTQLLKKTNINDVDTSFSDIWNINDSIFSKIRFRKDLVL